MLKAETKAGKPPGQGLRFDCSCGRVHEVAGVRHYDRIILGCGLRVWALQPKRNGPLKLVVWPGSYNEPIRIEQEKI